MLHFKLADHLATPSFHSTGNAQNAILLFIYETNNYEERLVKSARAIYMLKPRSRRRGWREGRDDKGEHLLSGMRLFTLRSNRLAGAGGRREETCE